MEKGRCSKTVTVAASVMTILIFADRVICSLGIGNSYSILAAAMPAAENRSSIPTATAACMNFGSRETCDLPVLISNQQVKVCELKTVKDKLTTDESLIGGVHRGIARTENRER